jgi:hypothetical protein
VTGCAPNHDRTCRSHSARAREPATRRAVRGTGHHSASVWSFPVSSCSRPDAPQHPIDLAFFAVSLGLDWMRQSREGPDMPVANPSAPRHAHQQPLTRHVWSCWDCIRSSVRSIYWPPFAFVSLPSAQWKIGVSLPQKCRIPPSLRGRRERET